MHVLQLLSSLIYNAKVLTDGLLMLCVLAWPASVGFPPPVLTFIYRLYNTIYYFGIEAKNVDNSLLVLCVLTWPAVFPLSLELCWLEAEVTGGMTS